ncbi:hypothetical protein CF326_g9213 [Tilletia indica]|nr:hypothetical protein CF326_g9213 [Tilletia indica]
MAPKPETSVGPAAATRSQTQREVDSPKVEPETFSTSDPVGDISVGEALKHLMLGQADWVAWNSSLRRTRPRPPLPRRPNLLLSTFALDPRMTLASHRRPSSHRRPWICRRLPYAQFVAIHTSQRRSGNVVARSDRHYGAGRPELVPQPHQQVPVVPAQARHGSVLECSSSCRESLACMQEGNARRVRRRSGQAGAFPESGAGDPSFESHFHHLL